MSVLSGYIFTSTYTTDDFITDFKARFSEFASVDDNDLENFISVACDILPSGLPDYFDSDVIINILMFAVAHLCAYFDITNMSGEVKTVLKNASSMSANGLSISFTDVAKLRGDFFNAMNDFFSTTSYGRLVCVYLGKIAGSVGGFVI